MNYEKKYKSALEWIRSIYPTMQGADKEDAEHYFPELRESEDEMIRKAIVKMISDIDGGFPFEKHGIIKKKALAWLEKQGEKMPAWSEEDEKMISLLIKIFEINHPNEHFKVNSIGTTNMEAMSTKEILDWLKSLKPQKHWKPSEEQMEGM